MQTVTVIFSLVVLLASSKLVDSIADPRTFCEDNMAANHRPFLNINHAIDVNNRSLVIFTYDNSIAFAIGRPYDDHRTKLMKESPVMKIFQYVKDSYPNKDVKVIRFLAVINGKIYWVSNDSNTLHWKNFSLPYPEDINYETILIKEGEEWLVEMFNEKNIVVSIYLQGDCNKCPSPCLLMSRTCYFSQSPCICKLSTLIDLCPPHSRASIVCSKVTTWWVLS